MRQEELEYEPVGVCLLLEAEVGGRRRSVTDEDGKRYSKPRQRAWLLRGATGSSLSPDDKLIILSANYNAAGQPAIPVDKLRAFPPTTVDLPEVRRALRRSRA